MSNVSTEILRRVYDDNEGVFIEVGQGPDGHGVGVRTTDSKSKSWFGSFEITLSHEQAEQLGHALIAASKENL